MPVISVIMPVYNGAAHLRPAVDSVLRQSFGDFELLLVDDGSVDESVPLAKGISDPRVRLIENGRNLGPAASRNRALDLARGQYVAFFDSDDVAHPDWLATEVGFLKAQSGYKIVDSWQESINENGDVIRSAQGYSDKAEKLHATMLFSNCLSTSTLLVERPVIGDLRFAEDLPVASDYDLWVRLLERGRAFVLRKNLAQYRVHPTNITHRKQELARACLGRIMKSQLSRLELQPNDSEVDLHLNLTRLTFGTSRAVVLASEKWLMTVQAANEKTKVYESEPFRQVLGDRWHGVCHSACANGLWLWNKFRSSPLGKSVLISRSQKLRLVNLVLRASVKNAFPRLSQWAKRSRFAA
jgi:glycosyltransferase involved in cell wall biosynthesis